VFSDLVAEIQRSIGFFTSNNRNAKLGDVVALGNPMKLPGLQRFLSQNLDQEVKLIDQFNNLVGGTATASPQFKENQLTFGVAYGLCVQALDSGQLRTNLLPEEIITTRLVRAKKPWAVAAVALLLVGLTINYLGHYSSWKTADKDEPAMAQAISAAGQISGDAGRAASEHTALAAKYDEITKIGYNLQSNVDGRLLWLEVLKAIDAALPKDERPADQRKEAPEDVAQRTELHIQSIDCEYFADVSSWFAGIEPIYNNALMGRDAEAVVAAATAAAGEGAAGETAAEDDAAATTEENGEAAPADGAPAGETTTETPAAETAAAETPAADAAATDTPQDDTTPVADASSLPADGTTDPAAAGAVDPVTGLPVEGDAAGGSLTGEGWIIELRGYHLHNSIDEPKVDLRGDEGWEFVQNTFIKNLENATVQLPDGPGGQPIEVAIKDLGIKYPVILTFERIKKEIYAPEAVDDTTEGGMATSISSYGYGYGRGGGDERGVLGATGALPGVEEPKTWKLGRYDFVVQFCWQPQPRGARLKKLAGGETSETPSTAAVDTQAADTGDSS
jgi:type IV pilus assembly protein PilM